MVERINSARTAGRGRTAFLLIIGWICAIVSVFLYPFIFGVLGVIMGILATKNGGRAGLYLIVSSIILMGIGLIFGGVILNYMTHYLRIEA